MKRTFRQKSAPWLFVGPAVLSLLLFMVAPIVLGLALGFFRWSLADLKNSPAFVGLDNFARLFSFDQFYRSLGTTAIYVFAVVVVQLLLGLLIALLLEKKLPGIQLFRSIFLLPIMISPVVVGVIWKYMYDANFGVLNYILSRMGQPALPWLSSEKLALLSIIITDIWQWTPFVFLILLAGLHGVPEELMEAGHMDGASYLQGLWHIKLPCIGGIVRLVLTLRMIESLRGLVVIFIMTNGGPGTATMTVPMFIYRDAMVNQELGRAAAAAIVLMVLLIALTAFSRLGSAGETERH